MIEFSWRSRMVLACSCVALALAGCQTPTPTGSTPASRAAAAVAPQAQTFGLLGGDGSDGWLGATQPIAVAEDRERLTPVSAFNLQDDGYMAVWLESEFDYQAIVGQRLDADGRPIGDEFVIRKDKVRQPQIVYNHLTNEFLVTWVESRGNRIDDPEVVVAQRIGADGKLHGQAADVAQGPFIESLKAAYDIKHNQYLLVFNSHGRVAGQLLNAGGHAVGGELTLGLHGAAGPKVDVVYNVRDDQFFVVWDEVDVLPHAVWSRQVKGDGTVDPRAYMVSHSAPSGSPAVAYNYDDDTYMVAYSTLAGVAAARFSPTQLAIGSETTVSATAAIQPDVAIAYNHLLDEFLISWTDNRNPLKLEVDPAYPNPDVYAQRVAANGALVDGNVAIAASADFREATPSVTSHCRTKGYLVLWNQLNAAGPFGVGPFNIYGRRVGE